MVKIGATSISNLAVGNKNIDLLNFDCVNMFCNQISFLNYLKLLSI